MTRFHPTRAGVVNLWDYGRQEFSFREGWLVLRGANGSGKTKALEVLFPFVFDGRLDPRRLDPFSGRERNMRDNLLYRGDESALGYAWLELERSGPEELATITVGVGMRAQKARSQVETWFFVTDRGPIGGSWDVLDEEGRPRLRAALAEVLGEDRVRQRAEDHRRAVDAALFGLGAERYEGMLDLVLTLRRPQLAKDLDPDGLESILREGLRPVDPDLVGQAARAFEDLEAGQREVQQLQEANELVQKSAEQYRRYLRTVAAERARAALEAEEEAEGAGTRLRGARQAREEAGRAESQAKDGLTVLDQVRADHEADLRASQASAAYRAVGTLADKRRLVSDRRRGRGAAQAELDRAGEERAGSTERLQVATGRLRQARVEVREALERTNTDADAAGIEPLEGEDLDGARAGKAARLEQRRAELSRTHRALGDWQRAERGRDRTSEEQAQADVAVDEAQAQLTAAEANTARGRADLLAAVAGWWASQPEGLLEEADRDALAAAAQVDDPGDLGPVLEGRLAPRREAAVRAEAEWDQVLARVGTDLARAEDERSRIAAEQDDAPPTPPRRASERAGRQGAPLWRLVRFHDEVADDTRAAVEAALEAAGLLDAWVSPDQDPAAILDGFLSPGPPVEPHLGSLLEPETEFAGPPPVPLDRTLAVLASIGLAGQEASVGADGRFRLHLLGGAAAAPAARYVGASTRAARRRARLAELDAHLAALAEERTGAQRARTALAERRDAWRRAVATLPGVTPLRKARQAEVAAGSRLDERRQRARQAAEALDRAVQAERQAHRSLSRVAADCRLPTDAGELAQVEAAVDRFDRATQDLVLALTRQAGLEAAEEEAARQLRQAEGRVREREAALARADQGLAEVERELATLEATLGAEVQAVLVRVAQVEQALEDTRVRIEAAEAELEAATAARTAAREAEIRAEGALERQAGHLALALDGVASLADAALAEIVGAEAALARAAAAAEQTGTGRDAALLALARGLAQATAEVSPSPDRLKAAHTQAENAYVALLQDLPPDVGRVVRLDSGGVTRLSVHDAATDLSLGAFARNLERRVAQQAELLSARERQLLEDTLLAGLATQIQDRTHAARQLVRDMDQQMRQRHLSSGQTVGIAWTIDDDLAKADREALDLLARDPALLGPDGLARLRAHFADRIKARRAEQPDQVYREILAHVLDYRRWYRLRLYLYERDGSRQALTPARHARLSGGEKAATLHLPLFAAALARFTGGRPDCPRLVALDEAFAGIDDVGRPELLGLAAAFDLDLFMTGYDLWAAGPQVPAAAHYELMHLREAHEVVALQVDWSRHG